MCYYKRVVALRTTEKHVSAITIDQYLSNITIYEHRYLENIKQLYKSAVNCDDQQHYKAIIEASVVYCTEGFTDNIPMSPIQYVNMKNKIAIKPLRHFLDTLEVKTKTVLSRFCAAKSKCKSTRAGSMFCSSIPNRRSDTKINQRVKNLFTIGFYNILRLWCLQ